MATVPWRQERFCLAHYKIVNFNQMDLFQQRRIHRICEDVLMAMVIYDVYLVITYFLRRAFHDKIGIKKYPTFEFLR